MKEEFEDTIRKQLVNDLNLNTELENIGDDLFIYSGSVKVKINCFIVLF